MVQMIFVLGMGNSYEVWCWGLEVLSVNGGKLIGFAYVAKQVWLPLKKEFAGQKNLSVSWMAYANT